MRQSDDAECARSLSGLASSHGSSPEAIRADLANRLRRRSGEIEKTVLMKIRPLDDPVAGMDSAYAAGLRGAVAEMVNCGIEGIENDSEWPLPHAVASQTRRAASEGVPLDLVLRRYAAGSKALEEFIVVEAEDIPSRVLGQILSDQAPRVDRLLELVASEYKDEYERTRRSPTQKKAERLIRLAQSDSPGSPIDLDYDFDVWHVGLILKGPNAELVTRACAERLGYRSLHAARDSETNWAWLSSRRQPPSRKLEGLLAESLPPEVSIAMGEPRPGLTGWRLTHREAQMALQAMLQRPQRIVRGRNVILRVGVTRDDTLVRSLLDGYLTPLKRHANSEKLLEAVRAYLAAGGNAAAAAAAIGVTRHTVRRRIRAVEEALGRPFNSCQAELHVALQIDELDTTSPFGRC